MPPTKRARSAFSPPRPKSTKQAKSKSTASASTSKSKATSTRKPSAARAKRRPLPDEDEDDGEDENERSAFDLVDASASDNDDDNEHDIEATNDDDDDEAPSSPEPDAILVELTHSPSTNTSRSTPAIPTALLHHILAHNFTNDSQIQAGSRTKTKLSTDAREVLGKYVEVFVREAIMRCAFERGERDGNDKGDGWLEVEDLERVAVQLCLDF